MREPTIKCEICGKAFDFVFDFDDAQAEASNICEDCDSPALTPALSTPKM